MFLDTQEAEKFVSFPRLYGYCRLCPQLLLIGDSTRGSETRCRVSVHTTIFSDRFKLSLNKPYGSCHKVCLRTSSSRLILGRLSLIFGRLIRLLILLTPLNALLKDFLVFVLLAGDNGLVSQAFHDATLGLFSDLHLYSLLLEVLTEMHR